jgi:hypothetical protein
MIDPPPAYAHRARRLVLVDHEGDHPGGRAATASAQPPPDARPPLPPLAH